ncbi:polymer-forming cytoskeletal protein [Tahibacter amnicola]|uniref:Polymer-forming cytoskeletal protein n=1 Tax=Tahibacter amnicola TaxID=2976241 RepID=A0ABY6BJ83_9GAMM|nr:polymer-forming cytoskeletal protein [Tahibacter amnicola]UXI70073.1 polymer-forming cytoskeletal protein [Tahibacter amnicola]
MSLLFRLFAATGLCLGGVSASSGADWHSSADLVKRSPDRFVRADKAAIEAALQRADKVVHVDDYLREKNLTVYLHKGDLVVDGSFSNDDALIVDGNLTIRGSYDDYNPGIGVLLVTGDLRVENLVSWGTVAVNGRLDASGLVYAYYNDFTFEVGGPVKAQALVVYDKMSDYGPVEAAVVQTHDDIQHAQALRHFVPELMIDDVLEHDPEDGEVSAWASYGAATSRIHDELPLFRESPAPENLPADVNRLLQASVDEATIARLASSDRLLAMVAAAREKLPLTIQRQLLAQGDAKVLELLAGNPSTSKVILEQIAKAKPQTASAIATNPNAPSSVLAPMAQNTDPAVRMAVLEHADPPLEHLVKLAGDESAEVREALARSRHVRRLSAAVLGTLVNDKEAGVRAALPVHDSLLTVEQYAALAADTSAVVRVAVAESLSRQAVWEQVPVGETPAREALALRLSSDEDKQVVAAVLAALAPAEQERLAASAQAPFKRVVDVTLARHTRSVALMSRYAEGAQDLAEELAENLALPAAVQEKLVARLPPAASHPHVSRFDLEAFVAQSQTWDAVVAKLMENENAAASAVLATAKYCKAIRGDATFCSSLMDRDDLSADVFDVLAGTGDMEFREDWALTVLGSIHASRAQIERAVPLWYDDDKALQSAVKALGKHSDDAAWFGALAQSEHAQLREIAATNAATPPAVVARLLEDPEEDVRGPASANPSLPADVLARTAKSPSWALSNPAIPDALLRELLDRALAGAEATPDADDVKEVIARRFLRARAGQ